MNVKKLHPQANLPKRATEGSAGYDLYACLEQDMVINPGEIAKIPTGIAIALPEKNMVALVFGRSGNGVNHGVVPANGVGVIDSDYRGEIVVGLINNGKEPFSVHPADRIAQMVIVPIVLPRLVETDHLDETLRGADGFGSTGK